LICCANLAFGNPGAAGYWLKAVANPVRLGIAFQELFKKRCVRAATFFRVVSSMFDFRIQDLRSKSIHFWSDESVDSARVHAFI
jgi:hypothetical protein